MINYAPLWDTMKEKQITTYALIYKYDFSPYTITSLKHNKSITMHTLQKLCMILECTPNDVVQFDGRE